MYDISETENKFLCLMSYVMWFNNNMMKANPEFF